MGLIETDLSEEERRIFEIRQGFLEAHFRITTLFHDISEWIEAAETSDSLRTLAGRIAFARDHPDEPMPPELEPADPDTVELELTDEEAAALQAVLNRMVEVKAHYREMVSEMAVVYLVAAFEAFLADLLAFVLTCRPEFLKTSGKSLTFAEIVDSESREGLIVELARREVRGWQYKSFRDQVEILRNRFSTDLRGPDDDTDPEVIIEAFARRNLLLHNRGMVNATYLDLVPDSDANLGERVATTPEYWKRISKDLLTVANHLSAYLSARHLQPPD